MAAKNVGTQVEQFFYELTTALPYIQEAQQAIDRATGSKLNIFDLYLEPNEILLSRIIRDLLDPKGPHGQGEVFLRLFLKELDALDRRAPEDRRLKYINTSLPIEVICEMPTCYIEASRRRIDIVIEGSPDFVIGIENKPWASEQQNQIQDYHNHLSKKSVDTVFLVYLSGDGLLPNTIDGDTWKNCGYLLPYNANAGPSLKRWLEKCREASEAERVRWFLNDFVSYVSNAFTSEVPDGSQENVNG